MPFINGFATGKDIKIELFLFEPEQISDLVVVPLNYKISRYLSGLTYTQFDNFSNSDYPYWINYPFAYNITNSGRIQPNQSQPALFQRFNPYNKPFADEYSIKLFNFLNQFSNDYIVSVCNAHRVSHDYTNNSIPEELELIDLTDKVFHELTINTPNNSLTIEYSYYYPEIAAEEEVTILNASWRYHQYSRINNQCMKSPTARAWLLLFDSKFCNGSDFTIREDILNCSLVINFIDRPDLNLFWTDEDKEYILNQIPDYYLYDNLDGFFTELTNHILNQDSTILNPIEYFYKSEYKIKHGWFTRIEETDLVEYYKTINFDLQPKLLIIANNNNWNNNYGWIVDNTDNQLTYNDISNLIYISFIRINQSILNEDGTIETIQKPSYRFNIYSYKYLDTNYFKPRISYLNGGERYITYDTKEINVYNSDNSVRAAFSTPEILFYEKYVAPHFIKERNEFIFVNFSDNSITEHLEYRYKYSIQYYEFDYIDNGNTTPRYNAIESTSNTNIELSNNHSEGYDNFLEFTTEELITEITFKEELDFLITEEYKTLIYDEILIHQETCYMANCDLEDLKKDVKEIHAALDAGKFAYLDGSTENQRVANLGYYLERISRVLGISVNSDGSQRPIREAAIIEKGDSIPSGYGLGQWNRNNGASEEGQEGGNESEERDGMAWEIRSNKFVQDAFTGENTGIAQGGFALVENLPQLLSIIMADLDRAFGLQDAGANAIPSSDGETIVTYQGLNTMVLDLLYMLSQMSRNTSGAHICSLKNQAMLQEVFAALGLPTTVNEIEVLVANQETVSIPVPATIEGSPTLMDMFMLLATNLSILVGSKIKIKDTEETDNQ